MQNIPKPRAATSVAIRIQRGRVRNAIRKQRRIDLIDNNKRNNLVRLGHVRFDFYFHE